MKLCPICDHELVGNFCPVCRAMRPNPLILPEGIYLNKDLKSMMRSMKTGKSRTIFDKLFGR